METTAKYLVSHYQKTYELTYALWQGRNKTFLILLGAIGVATFVMFPALGARSILFLYVRHSLGLSEAELQAVQNGFPFSILQTIFLFVIFYLMVNLYHRSRYVLRNYAYLGYLEREIRQHLGLAASSFAFTRESKFYWDERDVFAAFVKWVYIILLSLLLLMFLAAAIMGDVDSRNWPMTCVDILFAAPTVAFLVAYAISSVRLDSKQAVNPLERANAQDAQ